MADTKEYLRMLAVFEELLGEHGCAWDKQQTHESLCPQMVEEVYEVMDAVKNGDFAGLQEELGDVLLHVVLQSKLASGEGRFTIDDVMRGLSDKLIYRHPHVFGDLKESDSEALKTNWEKLKRVEKGIKSATESARLVPGSFPALMRAQKVIKKATKAGMPSPNLNDGVDRAIALLSGIKTEGATLDTTFGDLLLEIANISTNLQINAEIALTNATEQFINRLEGFETEHVKEENL